LRVVAVGGHYLLLGGCFGGGLACNGGLMVPVPVRSEIQ